MAHSIHLLRGDEASPSLPQERSIDELGDVSAALRAAMHQLQLAATAATPRKEEIEGHLRHVAELYGRLHASIDMSYPHLEEELPLDISELSTGSLDAFLTRVTQENDEDALLLREALEPLLQFQTFRDRADAAAYAPSILTPAKTRGSLGQSSIDLMSIYDVHHENLIQKTIDKTQKRNRQLAIIQGDLSAMYEQRASGQGVDRTVFEAKYNEARDLLCELCEDLDGLSDYVDLPELEEGFEPTDEGVRRFCEKLELMKIRTQGNISDLSNEMHTFVQLYTIIIDIMKNMLEMDQEARRTIAQRTGA